MIHRYEQNPILTTADVPYPVATVHNAGAVKHEGRYLLLFRSHRRNGRSIIGLAESDDGYRLHGAARAASWSRRPRASSPSTRSGGWRTCASARSRASTC